MGIAASIERELERRGWSQYKLAQESGLKPQVISDLIKKDRNPQIDTIIKLANGFGISIDEFVVHPKPAPKIRGKPTGIKEARQCFNDLGLGTEDIEEMLVLLKHKMARSKGQGRVAAS